MSGVSAEDFSDSNACSFRLMKGQGFMKKSSTPYDDVHRTMVNDCPQLLIPLVNEVLDAELTAEGLTVELPKAAVLFGLYKKPM